jgi:hypothetical protein
MTRAEAEREQRLIQRTCKGPLIFTESVQKEHFDRIAQASLGNDSVTELRESLNKLRAFLGWIPPLPESIPIEKLLDQYVTTLRARSSHIGNPCGYDFNTILVSYPFDGKDRDYTCPNCGNHGVFKSPLYILE